MFRLIINVLCLAIGFGGGVYWGVNHPREAARVSTAEVDKMQKLEAKIHELVGDQPKVGNISDVLGSNGAPAIDPKKLQELDDDAQSQLNALKAKLSQ